MTQVYDVLAPVLGVANALALLLLVAFLAAGHRRQYFIVLIYVAWELLATAALTLADLHVNGTAQAGQVAQTVARINYARAYWTNDVVVDLLRFVLLTVLIYKVVGSSRPTLGRMLTGLVLVVTVLPFLLFKTNYIPYPSSGWFNSTSQLLNFGAAIMNLILWGALIQARHRDRRIVSLSIGMGILVTGTAVSYGLRHFIPQGAFTALFNLFLNLTQLTAWLIWCRAFWPERRASLGATAVPSR